MVAGARIERDCEADALKGEVAADALVDVGANRQEVLLPRVGDVEEKCRRRRAAGGARPGAAVGPSRSLVGARSSRTS
jgi:hypothetical protein